MTPTLRQFGALVPADFEATPVWVNCHTIDYDEPWYDGTDEETFRPWTGELPVDPSAGMFLVRAAFQTADGHEFAGFVTPAPADQNDDLGLIQPYLAAAGRFFGFWGGMPGIQAQEKKAFYAALGVTADQVFPVRFSCSPQLTTNGCSGSIAGFYRSKGRDGSIVET